MMIILLVYLSNILCSGSSRKGNTKAGSGISKKDIAMNEMRGVVGEIVRLAMIERVNQKIIENMDHIVKKAFEDVTNGVIDRIGRPLQSLSEISENPIMNQLIAVVRAKICAGTKDIKNIDSEEMKDIVRDIAKSIPLSLVKTNMLRKLEDSLTKQSITTMLGYFSSPNGESSKVDPKTLRANDLLNLFKEFNDFKIRDREEPTVEEKEPTVEEKELTVEEKESVVREIFNKVFGGVCTTFHYGLMNCAEGMSTTTTKEELLDKLYEEFEKGSMLFYGSEESDKRREEFINDPESFTTHEGYFTRDSKTFLGFDGSYVVMEEEKFIGLGRVYDVLILLCRFEIRDPTILLLLRKTISNH